MGKVWNYITEKLEKDKVLHFTLLDPDPLDRSIEDTVKMAVLAEKAGTDAIMIGGSTAFGIINQSVKAITESVDVPTILFPGNITGISPYADAIFFMSLLNSSNPYWIIGAQALASVPVKQSGIEPISLAYLLIEPGKTAGWVGEARLFPRDKPKLVLAYSLAAELLGFKMVYLEAGSGSDIGGVPPAIIKAVSSYTSIPIVVGGGLTTKEDLITAAKSGASIVVQGTFVERTVLKDGGKALKEQISALKSSI